jgi:hypothetical protein
MVISGHRAQPGRCARDRWPGLFAQRPATLASGAVIEVEIEDADAHDLFGVPA